MRQPWSGVVLGFFNTRNSSSVPVANHSIAHDENQNWLRDWLSMKDDMSLTFNGTCTNFHSNGETFGNATYVGDHDASVVPLTSTMIDLLAMSKGEKIRKQIAREILGREILRRVSQNQKKDKQLKILDIGCGIGLSTSAIAAEAQNVELSNTTILLTGIDSSHDRIGIAKATDIDHTNSNLNECLENFQPTTIIRYIQADAEKIPFRRKYFDLVFIMFVFHESSSRKREKILREARRVLKPEGILAIVDISRDYETPSHSSLGNTYLQEYQQNFKGQLSSLTGMASLAEGIVVPEHVVLYVSAKKTENRWWDLFGFWVKDF